MSPKLGKLLMDKESRTTVTTVIPIGMFLLAQTIAAVYWAGNTNATLESMQSWQERQDSRLNKLELSQKAVVETQIANQTLLELLLESVSDNNELLRNNIGSLQSGEEN